MSNLPFRADGRDSEVHDRNMSSGEKNAVCVLNIFKKALVCLGASKIESIDYDLKLGQGIISDNVIDKGDATLNITTSSGRKFSITVEMQAVPGILDGGIANPRSKDRAKIKKHVLARCLKNNWPVIVSYISVGHNYDENSDIGILILWPEEIKNILSKESNTNLGSRAAYNIMKSDYTDSCFRLSGDSSKMSNKAKEFLEKAMHKFEQYSK